MKKRYVQLFFAATFVLLFTACKGKEQKEKTATINDPKSLVQQFYKYVAMREIDSIRSISTPESSITIAVFSNVFQESAKNGDYDEKGALDALKNIILQEPRITGDNATVAVEDTVKGSKATMSLVKKNGEWKLDLSKPQ